MKYESLKAKIKWLLWVQKMTIKQIAAKCDCSADVVIGVLDQLDDEGVLLSEPAQQTNTLEHWVKKNTFQIKDMIFEVLGDKNGVATRSEILKILCDVDEHVIDSGIKALKVEGKVYSHERGVLKICSDTNLSTDKHQTYKAVNALYDPQTIRFKVLENGSLHLKVMGGKDLTLNPLESQMAYEALRQVYGSAS